MAGAKGLPDRSARIAALTELQRSLLVEAGAGSGKTSIMAGRVAMLFARGVGPKRVAAITFTEFAASELMIRITRFVAELAKGEIPRDLEIVFPGGVSAEQRANLERAKKSLDQLVCSTIHGFAQALIKPYLGRIYSWFSTAHGDLVLPDNISLLFLPPYSPQLNPKENLWDEIREKIFKNYAFKSIDAVRAKLQEAILYIERNPTIVKSITTFSCIAKSL